jgi:hypothetical protein
MKLNENENETKQIRNEACLNKILLLISSRWQRQVPCGIAWCVFHGRTHKTTNLHTIRFRKKPTLSEEGIASYFINANSAERSQQLERRRNEFLLSLFSFWVSKHIFPETLIRFRVFAIQKLPQFVWGALNISMDEKAMDQHTSDIPRERILIAALYSMLFFCNNSQTYFGVTGFNRSKTFADCPNTIAT